MRPLFLIKPLCVVTATFALLDWAVHAAGGAGPVFAQSTDALAGAGSQKKAWAYVAGVNVAISDKTTLALNMPDLTRYARKSSAAYLQLLFIPVTYFVLSFVDIVVGSAGEMICGELYWDPTEIIALWTDRAAAFFVAAAFGLASLRTKISTNSIATANNLALLASGWVNLRRGAVITDLVGE